MNKKYTEEQVQIAVNLCKKLAWKFARGNFDRYEEFLSVAYLGATKALVTYDDSKNVQFTTYCAKCANNEIFASFRYTKKEKMVKYFDDCLVEYKDADNISFEDTIVSNDNVEDAVMYKEMTKIISEYIDNNFSGIKKEIIKTKMNNNKLTQGEIAEIHNCSRSYVGRILSQAKTKVVKYLDRP